MNPELNNVPGVVEFATSASGENPRSFKTSIKAGEDLDAAVALYGHDAVFALYRAQLIIQAQSAIRRMLTATDPVLTDADVQENFSKWTPGVRSTGPRKTRAERQMAALSSMTIEELEAYLAQAKREAANAQTEGSDPDMS